LIRSSTVLFFPSTAALTAPEEKATWLEAGLGQEAQERFSVPVTDLVNS
jgi:hypothetical protein